MAFQTNLAVFHLQAAIVSKWRNLPVKLCAKSTDARWMLLTKHVKQLFPFSFLLKKQKTNKPNPNLNLRHHYWISRQRAGKTHKSTRLNALKQVVVVVVVVAVVLDNFLPWWSTSVNVLVSKASCLTQAVYPIKCQTWWLSSRRAERGASGGCGKATLIYWKFDAFGNKISQLAIKFSLQRALVFCCC